MSICEVGFSIRIFTLLRLCLFNALRNYNGFHEVLWILYKTNTYMSSLNNICRVMDDLLKSNLHENEKQHCCVAAVHGKRKKGYIYIHLLTSFNSSLELLFQLVPAGS